MTTITLSNETVIRLAEETAAKEEKRLRDIHKAKPEPIPDVSFIKAVLGLEENRSKLMGEWIAWDGMEERCRTTLSLAKTMGIAAELNEGETMSVDIRDLVTLGWTAKKND